MDRADGLTAGSGRSLPAGLDGALLERALAATETSFSITDPNLPGNPLIWVNPAFERITGYGFDDVVGRSCAFLQGPQTDPAAVESLAAAISERRSVTAVLLNHRRDGTAFWNELTIGPVLDAAGRVTHFVGVQADVTERVQAQQEREQLLVSAQNARSAAEGAQTLAEQAQAELRLLSGISELLSDTLDVAEAMQRLAEAIVPVLGTWCVIHLLSTDPAESLDGPAARQIAVRHVDPALSPVARRLQELGGHQASDSSSIADTLRTGTPRLSILDDTALSRSVSAAGGLEPVEIVRLYQELGLGPLMTVPLTGRNGVMGAIAIVGADGRPAYDADAVRVAVDIGRRAGVSLDNARLYQVEHNVAEALQRSLLPSLPEVPGLRLAARYEPASGSAQVGGDWYDVLQLPDGAVGIAVGDVMGHDLSAAAAMGQLRGVLRSYAWAGDRPGLLLDKLDHLVQGLDMAALATCLYARIQVDEEGLREGQAGPALLRWSNAGHLPPVLLRPGRDPVLLRDGNGVLIGVNNDLGEQRPESRLWLVPGSCLLLYTDGLVEARGHDVDDGMEALLTVVAGHELADGPAKLVDRVLDLMAPARTRDDDIAVLAVQVA